MSMTIPTTLPPGGQSAGKRKYPETTTKDSASLKKQRVTTDRPDLLSPSLEPYAPILAGLRAKYEIKPMSVLSSTGIGKHIDKALAHLGRFSFLDNSVLPGIVLLYAKSKAANKAVTIAETIRRRIAEGDQKWYQYNVLYEIASPADSEYEPSIIEDTVLMNEDDGQEENGGESGDGDNRSSSQTVFESAVEPIPVKNQAVMGIFISRVPVPELLPPCTTGMQTNTQDIEKKRRDVTGLR